MRKSALGLPLIEVAVIALLGALLAWQLFYRLERMAVETERIAMELTVANLRTALRWYQTRQLMGASAADLGGEPELTNPVALLEQAPATYVGVVEPGQTGAVPPGSWYFDKALGQLCYRPKAEVDMKGVAICYALRRKGNEMGDVVLQLTTPYRWQ
ncbi:hypothetical protein OPU71_02930 [Niveibacterium sp. 24ML]|uniref:hypothetical protein n=1 Tax=Niveibacterium sp. 24ML TaxID=2985512 RepID=UPI00226E0EE5|nr:hypothetical protein [Niveibacterium sp. 24ML]MCX9155073.1 hypothetical protein [Niveibacterium sp. 24ML]